MKKTLSIAVVFFALVSTPALLYAQDNKTGDTLSHYTDSVKEEVTPPADREASPGEGYDEDGDKTGEKKTQYFLPKTSPDSLQLRNINDSMKHAMATDNDFWYADAVFKKKDEKDDSRNHKSFVETDGFQLLLWLLIIGGFIAFLVIYLGNSNIRLFRKSKTIASEEDDPETDDIFAINYQKEIDKAIAAGNYRLAVRLLYLHLLRQLSEKHIIQYAQDRTNFDYLVQMNQTKWYKQFFRLTRSYEYVWYGLFEVDSARFELIKNDFTDMERQL